AAVRGGDLAPGARLPTVRELAGNLALAANTVARSYRELEAAGVVVTRGRRGTFVAAVPEDPDAAGRRAAEAYVERSRELGLEPGEALALVAAALGLDP
ncbi:MAG TPA: GntR family transcriptional regulator, partial [Acidimicrobiales bacterium]|nr:GntR family transcriptional regulator [Acidimicrobiales bacterium]